MKRHQNAEAAGLISFIICGFIGGVGTWLYMQTAPAIMQLMQRRFLASASIIAACGVVSFIVGYLHATFTYFSKRHWLVTVRRVFEIVALSMVYGATLFVVSFLVFSVVNLLMGHALFSTYLVAVAACLAGMGGYLTFVQAELMDAKTLASLLFVFVLSGVGTACVTNDNTGWYNNNFSQLGDRTTFAATMFNATLILGGLCIMIISYFALSELATTYKVTNADGTISIRHVHTRYHIPKFKARLTILGILLFMCGLAFVGIGTFRYTPHPDLHNLFARTMAIWMGLFILGLPWWAPQLSNAFYVVSDICAFIVALLGVAWLKGITPLTNVEAACGIMFLGWFIMFCRQIAAIEADRIQQQIMESRPLDAAMVEELVEEREDLVFNPIFSTTHNPVTEPQAVGAGKPRAQDDPVTSAKSAANS
ncbi:MAG: ABC transporter permease [Bifidobacterium sp.]|nr:ABC transporter permease [Bifidobacterium sp.]